MASGQVAKLPFVLHGEHLFVQAKINGSETVELIFDPSQQTTLHNAIAQKLGITSTGEVEIAGLKLANSPVIQGNMQPYELKFGRRVDGIIGAILFKNYVVRIDYDSRTISFFDFKTFQYTGKGETFKFKLRLNTPMIQSRIATQTGEIVSGDFLVNCSAGFALILASPFVSEYKLSTKIGAYYKESLLEGTAGKGTASYFGRVKSLNAGSFGFANTPVVLSTAQEGLLSEKQFEGIIGNTILKKFNITYDYKRKVMYWEKNAEFNKAFAVNCSGIEIGLTPTKDKILITNLYEKSPATEAGLKADDEILTVNGKSALELGLEPIRDLLEVEGQTVELKIRSGSQEKTVSLKLKKLI